MAFSLRERLQGSLATVAHDTGAARRQPEPETGQASNPEANDTRGGEVLNRGRTCLSSTGASLRGGEPEAHRELRTGAAGRDAMLDMVREATDQHQPQSRAG